MTSVRHGVVRPRLTASSGDLTTTRPPYGRKAAKCQTDGQRQAQERGGHIVLLLTARRLLPQAAGVSADFEALALRLARQQATIDQLVSGVSNTRIDTNAPGSDFDLYDTASSPGTLSSPSSSLTCSASSLSKAHRRQPVTPVESPTVNAGGYIHEFSKPTFVEDEDNDEEWRSGTNRSLWLDSKVGDLDRRSEVYVRMGDISHHRHHWGS